MGGGKEGEKERERENTRRVLYAARRIVEGHVGRKGIRDCVINDIPRRAGPDQMYYANLRETYFGVPEPLS